MSEDLTAKGAKEINIFAFFASFFFALFAVKSSLLRHVSQHEAASSQKVRDEAASCLQPESKIQVLLVVVRPTLTPGAPLFMTRLALLLHLFELGALLRGEDGEQLITHEPGGFFELRA